MSLFGNLFGKKPEPQKERSDGPEAFFPPAGEIDLSDWDQVFSACLGKMFTVQNRLAELVKDEPSWNVDFGRGVLTLGGYQFHIQFLGSESYVSQSWLWGWENVNKFPGRLLGQAYVARACGQTWGLKPLMYAQCGLNDAFNGHSFSMVVCGALAENHCYYRCPTGEDQGAAFVAVTDAPQALFQPVDGIAFLNSVSQCIQHFHLNHKIFVESFLRWSKIPFGWTGDTLTAHFDTSDVIVDFEQAGENYRIKNLKQVVKA